MWGYILSLERNVVIAFFFLENLVRIIILESQHLVVLPRVMNVCGTTV